VPPKRLPLLSKSVSPKVAKSANPAVNLPVPRIPLGLSTPTTLSPISSVFPVKPGPAPKNCATLPPTVLGCSIVGAIASRSDNKTF
jgi:hypothetical protein